MSPQARQEAAESLLLKIIPPAGKTVEQRQLAPGAASSHERLDKGGGGLDRAGTLQEETPEIAGGLVVSPLVEKGGSSLESLDPLIHG
jgi:hypothetical protein